MLLGAILEFYDSVTTYLGLTHSIRKNKEKVDLEFFLLRVNDGNTDIKKLKLGRVVDILRERRPAFPQIFRISLFLLLSVLNAFPHCDHFFKQ